MSGRHRRRAARWLLLVGLTVAGIIGMHGLVGSPAEAMPAHTMAATSPHAADHHGATDHHGTSDHRGAPATGEVALSSCSDGCAGHAAMGMGSMCLAFVSLLLLLLLPRRGVLTGVTPIDLLRPAAPVALRRRRAPPDLHDLAILRC